LEIENQGGNWLDQVYLEKAITHYSGVCVYVSEFCIRLLKQLICMSFIVYIEHGFNCLLFVLLYY